MNQIIVIFDRPLVLPGDKFEEITSYGLCFKKSRFTSLKNIKTYLKHYVMVIAELFKDKTVEFIDKNNIRFMKNGKVFGWDDEKWERYDRMAEKSGLQFAVFDNDIVMKDCDDVMKYDDIVITDDDRYDILLTSEEKWKHLKERKDIVWQS